ncbi:hypothetical protein D9M72_575720 [compost metagenome]
MRGTVKLFPGGGIFQAVVRAGVDHYRSFGQLGGDFRGGSVRKRQEHNVVARKVLHGGVLQDAARQTVEMRLQFA